jgi:hypothetical protein
MKPVNKKAALREKLKSNFEWTAEAIEDFSVNGLANTKSILPAGTYIYINMCVYVYVYMYMYIFMYFYICIYTCACLYICIMYIYLYNIYVYV